MKKRGENKFRSKFILGFIAFLSFIGMAVSLSDTLAAQTQPSLAIAREVSYTKESTEYVDNGSDFVAALNNLDISRIVLNSDIDVSSNQANIRSYDLTRSLQIDGNSHTITAKQYSGPNDVSFLNIHSASNATIHLKDITFIAGGMNIIDDSNNFSRSTNWHIILDNVFFPKAATSSQANRVLRMRNGHLFLRNKVEMYTNAENMYIGQITVENDADVYGEINYYDYSTWWFVAANSNGNMDIGENAKVSLNGVGGTTYPTVYQHFRTINVFKNATFITRKPGNALRFNTTAGVSDKYINVFEGATLDAASTGTGAQSIIDTGASVRGHFYAAPKSKIYMIGSSASNTIPLIDLSNDGSSFELEQPERYDLRNNRTTGYVARVGSGAKFKITNSDIEVWKKGSNAKLDEAPTNSWFLSSVVANSSGDPIAGSDDSMTGIWKTTDYARITGLNTNPVLKFQEITDADKNFNIEAYILNDAAWNEQVTINVTNDKNSDVFKGKNNDLGIYNFTSNNFFKAGTVLTATGYRGVVEWSTLNPQATTIVKDVTPPTPAQVSSILPTTATKISGTSNEPSAKVTVTLNGEIIKDSNGEIVETTVDNNGKWTFDIPANINLNLGDKLQILLKDDNGNQNPTEDKAFHDAIFKKGTIINVVIAPKINADKFIEVQQNSTYDATKDVSATNSKGENVSFGNGDFDLSYSTNVDTNTLGVYKTTYTMKDAYDESIITTFTTKVIVKNNNSIIDYDNGYMISANDYSLLQNSDVITGSHDEVISKSNASAWDLNTTLSTNVIVNSDTYSNKVGGYNIQLVVENNTTVDTYITASILGENTIVENGYAIDANSFFIAKKEVKGDVDLIDPDKTNIKIWNTSDVNLKAQANVYNNGGYSVSAKEGTYDVILNIIESTITQVTIKATIVDRDVVINSDKYAIGANNVVIGKKDALDIVSDQDLIDVANVQSWRITGVNDTVSSAVLNSDFKQAPGLYTVEYAVNESKQTSISVTIEVVDADYANQGDKYTLIGNDFSINTTTAQSIGTDDIIERSIAKAWQNSDKDIKGTIKVTSNTIKPSIGSYAIELYIDEEPTTSITINVNVTNGEAPILNVLTPTEIQIGDNFDKMANVSANDKEDGIITNKIVVTGDYDTNTAGVYVLTYSVVDSDYNTVSHIKVLIVNDGRFEIGSNYIIEAHDFIINKADVDTTNEALIKHANVKGYNVIDGTNANVSVLNANSYSANVGTYNIDFAIADELSTHKTIKATVVDYDNVEVGDNYSIGANNVVIGIEDARDIDDTKLLTITKANVWKNNDYNLKGVALVDDRSDIQAAVGTYTAILKVSEEPDTKVIIEVKVIDSDKVSEGNKYSIAANNVIIGTKQATEINNNEDLIKLSNAHGWLRSNFNEATSVKIINSNFVAAIGTYNVTFAISDEESTRVGITITVIDYNQVITGNKYLIGANDFAIDIAKAEKITEDEIINKANATSWIKETMNTSGTIKVTNNKIQAIEGIYDIELYVIEEPDTKLTIKVSVSKGNPPTLNITSPIVINLGDNFEPKKDVSAIGDEGDITNSITYDGIYDVNTAGIYVLTYSVTDVNYNTVSAKRVLVVDDGSFVIGDDYILKANNFVVNATDVNTDKQAIINQAKAESYIGAYDKHTGESSTITILDTGGYEAKLGNYNITFAAENEQDLKKTIKATVVDYDAIQYGDNYSIGANNIVIGKEVAKNISSDDVISLSLAQAWQNTNFDTKSLVEVVDMSPIKAEPGTYNIVLRIKEEPNTKLTIQVKVLDYDKVIINGGYIIAANNVVIGKDIAQTVIDDQDLIDITNATAWQEDNLNDEVLVAINSSNYLAATGNYNVNFKVVAQPSTNVEVAIVVTDTDHAKKGQEYLIKANNFRVNTTQASKISATDIISHSKALALLIEDTDIEGIVRVTSNSVKAIQGVYDVELYVEEEPATKVKIQVTVSDGSIPTLDFTTPIEINIGQSFNLMSGVKAIDIEDGTITDDVNVSGAYNTNNAGVYVLTYSITDSDFNTVTKKRVLVVNDGRFVVGTDYIIEAQDFIINKKDVKTTNNAIIENANARGYDALDGSQTNVSVVSKNGYTNTRGTYTIDFAITNDLTLNKSIKATVIDYSVVETGAKYSIGANDIVIGLKDAKELSDTKLLELTSAKSWENTDYANEGTVNIEVNDIVASVGVYDVVFNVAEETTTKVAIKVRVVNNDRVVEGDKYSIGANDVVIGKKQAETILTNQDLINITKAKAWLNSDVNQATSIKVLNSSFIPSVGVHNVTFAIVSDESITVTTTIEVLDYDLVTTGDKHLLGANDFTINTTQAQSITENDIITKSNATSWLKDTMNVSGTVKITKNTIKPIESVYNIELYVADEPNTKVIIKVTVSDGNAPILTINSPIEINVGESFDAMEGVSAIGDEGDLTSSVTYDGMYDINTIGIYVLNYSVTDANYNTVSAKRVLVVNDGRFVLGSNYILEAHSFVINRLDVDTSNQAIINSATANAYSIEDGSMANVTVVDKGGYTEAVNSYNIKFAVANELETNKIIKATVVDYDKKDTGANYSIGANNIIIGLDTAKSITDKKLLLLTQASSWKNNDFNIKGTVEVQNIEDIIASPGSYNLTLKVVEESTTKIEITVQVIDNDVTASSKDYVIGANNVVIGQKDALKLINDNDFIELMNVQAWNKTDLTTTLPVVIEDSNFVAATGLYTITYALASDTSVSVEANLTVVDNDYITSGERYIIGGDDFTINTTQAAIIDDNNIIANANAKSWLKENMSINGTVKVKENKIKDTSGSYFIELYVAKEPTTIVIIKVTVSNGNVPILSVQTPTEISIGQSFDVMNGVEATDYEDGTITNKVNASGSYNINVAGIYVLTYSITDNDYNTVTKKRVLIVNDGRFIIGTDYIIEAQNFIINKSDVNTASTKIINSANAKGYSIVDGSQANVVVKKIDGYGSKVGIYDIVFGIDNDANLTKAITATVIDYSVVEVGSKYSIGANDIVISTNQAAKLDDATLLDLNNAQSWKNNDYNMKGNVEVVDRNKVKAIEGTYDVTLGVVEEPVTQVTTKVHVINNDVVANNNNYAIGANDFYLSIEDAKKINDATIITKSHAKAVAISNLSTVANVGVQSHNIKDNAGVYDVVLNVVEEPSVKIDIKAIVVDYDTVTNGSSYVIAANDIILTSSEAKKITAKELISKSSAKAWLRNDDRIVSVALVNDNIFAKTGTYQATFKVVDEPTTKITINVKVVADESKINDPKINDVYENDKYISGISDSNTKIIVTLPNSKKINTITDDSGAWKIKVPTNTKLKYKDQITVQAMKDSLKSNKVSTIVKKNNNNAIAKTGNDNLAIVLIIMSFASIALFISNSVYRKDN